MFLPANVQIAMQAMSGFAQGAAGIAALVGVAVEHKMFFAQGLHHIKHGLQVFVLNNGRHRGFARGVQIASGHRQHRLANKLDNVDGQQRIAGQQRAYVFEAGNVGVGDHQPNAVEGIAGRGINPEDFGVSTVGQACIKMQLVRKFQAVVDVLRFTRHVLLGAVVFNATAHTGLQVLLEEGAQFGLCRFGRVMVRHKLSPAFQGGVFAAR